MGVFFSNDYAKMCEMKMGAIIEQKDKECLNKKKWIEFLYPL